MELLVKLSTCCQLLQEVKKPKSLKDKKNTKSTSKDRNKKELTLTKSSMKQSSARKGTPQLSRKAGQQRARKASTSGDRGAGRAR
jgi:hypothetical protein